MQMFPLRPKQDNKFRWNEAENIRKGYFLIRVNMKDKKCFSKSSFSRVLVLYVADLQISKDDFLKLLNDNDSSNFLKLMKYFI